MHLQSPSLTVSITEIVLSSFNSQYSPTMSFLVVEDGSEAAYSLKFCLEDHVHGNHNLTITCLVYVVVLRKSL